MKQIVKMEGNYLYSEGKTLKEISLDTIKLLFFHYFFDERSAGVNKVIENNIKGLKLYYPNIQPILAAGGFEKGIFDGYEKRFIDLGQWEIFKKVKSKLIQGNLEKITHDVDIISAHNVLRGINPIVTEALRNFSDKSHSRIQEKIKEYRNHDFILRYPDDYWKMISYFKNFKNIFPKNPDVMQTTLTTSTRRDMEIFYRGNIEIMRNSVVYDDLIFKDDGKDEKLKELLMEKGIFEEGMRHVIYAVRADERKNLEEALFLTNMMSYVTGKPHKLVVTASREKDYKRPEDNKYQRDIEKFAECFNIPYSIGEAYKYVDGKEFNIGHLYRAGDIAVTTAFKEGFGYAFVEPWVAFANPKSKDKFSFGRWIREVCEDFEKNGMKFRDIFYDNNVLYSKGTPEDRMAYFSEIMSNKDILNKFVKRVDLERRIHLSKEYNNYNASIIKTVYGHDVVARDLAKLYKLPNWKELFT